MDDIFDTRFEDKEVELSDGKVNLGDNVNLTEKDPTLRKIFVGCGWESNHFNADAFDADVSLFLLGTDEMTRSDEDFVFFNNVGACDGGIRHKGDNRTGVGEGDDEAISIDLHSVPFDVVKIMIVFSIYKGRENGQDLAGLSKTYVRLVNEENGMELLRFDLDAHFAGKSEDAALIGSLNREGPKWHFTPLAETDAGGLAAIAERYGMVIGAQ